MKNKIWFMEGLSSQRDIIQSVNDFSKTCDRPITIYASHRNERNEILSLAHFSLIEPKDDEQRLAFIEAIVKEHAINVIHTGRHCQWFETHRQVIESSGVVLTTGASGVDSIDIADDKVAFAQLMEKNGLPVVPSVRITTLNELKTQLTHSPFMSSPLCVKPVKGIYGMGFWRFDDAASSMTVINYPERRLIPTWQYLAACESAGSFEPLVLMPYLPGPEYSVDMLVNKGTVLAAVGRRKEGALQYLENTGEAYDLARACAAVMKADGLVNVQTRHDESGKPVLLEINMRPSGGIGYTRHSGVNLPGLYAGFTLGYLSESEVRSEADAHFRPAVVRAVTEAIAYQPLLTNTL